MNAVAVRVRMRINYTFTSADVLVGDLMAFCKRSDTYGDGAAAATARERCIVDDYDGFVLSLQFDSVTDSATVWRVPAECMWVKTDLVSIPGPLRHT